METTQKIKNELTIDKGYIETQVKNKMDIDLTAEECNKILDVLFRDSKLIETIENAIRKVLTDTRFIIDLDDDLIIGKDYIMSCANEGFGCKITPEEYDDIYETINEEIPLIVSDNIRRIIESRD